MQTKAPGVCQGLRISQSELDDEAGIRVDYHLHQLKDLLVPQDFHQEKSQPEFQL